MKNRYYSQYLLRVLDGEDLQLDRELSALAAVGSRVRCAVPVTPSLREDARRRIWSSVVSGTGEPIVLERRVPRVPRLAWAAAAVAVVAVIAVLAVLLINGGGPVIREPVEMASLYIERGEIDVRNAEGEERPARSGEALAEGDVILASTDARGVVEFASGSVMRFDGRSEVGLTSGEAGVEVEVIRGNTYHRVIDGESYEVGSGDVSVTALGTAFVFDVAEEHGKVVSVHSSLRLDADTASLSDDISRLEEGDVFLFGEGQEARILDVTREELDNEWIRWNKEQDEGLGLPVGVLSILEEEVAPAEPQPQPEAAPPAEEQPDQPAPQPTPTPEPPPPPPPVQNSVVLSASAREGAVDFSWSLTGYTGFQGFKLCRSETNPAPSYPGDWWKYIDGANTRSATDGSVESGHTYFYRLAVYSNGAVLGYSNAVQVTVPGPSKEPSISLSGGFDGGKVHLSWNVSDAGSYDGFKVCRSETNPSPSYPGDTCTLVPAGQYSYADTSVVSGKTYYYRVGIYKDGSIVKYSNAIKITVP